MRDDSEANALARERLSALLDGELVDAPVAQVCDEWRDDASLRATWHAYHLIGDVLRSDDLAVGPARDASLLAAVRLAMRSEPVVFAPQPLAAGNEPGHRLSASASAAANPARGRRWRGPTALAASVVVVAGVVTMTRDRSGAPELARIAPLASSLAVSASAPGPIVVKGAPVSGDAQGLVATGQMIRDARLDRYLDAHKQFAGSSALGVPSAYLRNATAELPGR